MCETVHELTSAIASSDTEAFSRFYRRWFDFAFAEARRASRRDEHFCLDIVQDSMMRVIRSIKPMNTETDVERWLRTVVHSCCMDQFRSEQRRRRRERAAGIAKSETLTAESSDRIAWLRRQLDNLEPHQLSLLSMRFRFDWKLRRIAAALGLKPGAVDGRISRLLAHLRDQENGGLP